MQNFLFIAYLFVFPSFLPYFELASRSKYSKIKTIYSYFLWGKGNQLLNNIIHFTLKTLFSDTKKCAAFSLFGIK